MLYLYAALIAAALIVYPYLRIFVMRLMLLYGLRDVCKMKGYILHRPRRVWIFDGFSDSTPSFFIESPDKVYSVKLVGAKAKSQYIKFIDEGHYSLRKVYGYLRGIHGGATFAEDIEHKKNPYDFTADMPQSCASKELLPVILICPVPNRVSAHSHGLLIELGNGDHNGEGYIYTRSGFLSMLADGR